MTNDTVRAIFDKRISEIADQEKIAKLEVVREYFCNEEFRKAMQDYVWEINQIG